MIILNGNVVHYRHQVVILDVNVQPQQSPPSYTDAIQIRIEDTYHQLPVDHLVNFTIEEGSVDHVLPVRE